MYAPDPHMWPADALERVAAAIENLTAEEARVGLESTAELRGASSPLPEVSDATLGGAR